MKHQILRVVLGLMSGIILTLVAGIFYTNMIFDQHKAEINDYQSKVEKLESSQRNSDKRADSLFKEASMFAKYRTLDLAMTHRDAAGALLKFEIGEAAYLKSDSSRVIVSDIVIGGSSNMYYIRYRITNKNNLTEEIIPELLFK
jgi:hypothetical protein